MRTVEPRPWSPGMRFQDEPRVARRASASLSVPMFEGAPGVGAGHLQHFHRGPSAVSQPPVNVLTRGGEVKIVENLLTKPGIMLVTSGPGAAP